MPYHLDEDEEPLLDHNGQKIPSTICLCFAHSKDECLCGAWDIPVDYHKTKVLPKKYNTNKGETTMTKVTIQNEWTKVTVEVEEEGLTVEEILEDCIKPALLGLQYHPNNVESICYVDFEDEDNGEVVDDPEFGITFTPAGE